MNVPLLDLAAEYAGLRPAIDAAVARIIDATAFVGGEEVREFQHEFAAFLGVEHALGVANGTDALEVALQALGVGPGDAVVTVPFTFAAPLEAIVRCGAEPVLVDIGADHTIDVDAVAAVLRSRPIKAVIAVHLYGLAADLDRLLPLCRAHGAALVEDAAQAHGAWCTVSGTRRRAGAVGDVGCFSFYPTKNLGAMGDAGALVTNRADVAERARLLANHGERVKYEHAIPNGRNSRLDALQAAVLRIKLPHLDDWNAARRAVAARYREGLAGSGLGVPTDPPGRASVYHQFVVRAADRDGLRAALAARGVGSAIHYPLALHLQDGWRRLGYPPGSLPRAERAAAEVVSLPMSPFMRDDQIAHVIASVLAADAVGSARTS